MEIKYNKEGNNLLLKAIKLYFDLSEIKFYLKLNKNKHHLSPYNSFPFCKFI